MIDTDKYKGHTEGPWKAFEDIEGADTDTPYRTGSWAVGNAIYKSASVPLHFTDEHDPYVYNAMGICMFQPNRQNNEADAKLIADAPLLKEEVKRLQDALKEAVEVVKEMESMAYADAHNPTILNHALEFIGNVRELIE
ncbi:MAG: hypothetical protein VW270_24685 [Candidatus Poseidoniales archaeon]